MTDNRTTELLRDYAFALRRLEYDADKPGSNMTLGEYEAEEKKITDEYSQAIAATLGSGECELAEVDSYSNTSEVIHVLECSACGQTCEHVNGSYPKCPHCGRSVKR